MFMFSCRFERKNAPECTKSYFNFHFFPDSRGRGGRGAKGRERRKGQGKGKGKEGKGRGGGSLRHCRRGVRRPCFQESKWSKCVDSPGYLIAGLNTHMFVY